MTIEELEKQKLQAELGKLDAEQRKLEEEIKHLKLPVFLNPKVLVALIVAAIGLIGTSSQLYLKSNKLVTVEKEKDAIEIEHETDVEALIKNADREEGAQKTNVVIRFRGSITREQITGLQTKLNKGAYLATRPFRTPSIDEDQVVYYSKNDKAMAQDILNSAEQYFSNLDCPIPNLDLRHDAESTKYTEGTVVLTVYHKCG